MKQLSHCQTTRAQHLMLLIHTPRCSVRYASYTNDNEAIELATTLAIATMLHGEIASYFHHSHKLCFTVRKDLMLSNNSYGSRH